MLVSWQRLSFLLLFFQAEDGIRYRNVTGVQTCALPISIFQLAHESFPQILYGAFDDRQRRSKLVGNGADEFILERVEPPAMFDFHFEIVQSLQRLLMLPALRHG